MRRGLKLVMLALALAGVSVMWKDATVGARQLPPEAKMRVDFARDIEPILKGRCIVCHGSQQQMGGLRLDRRADALRGGNSGPVITAGDSAASRLIRLVAGLEKGLVMPPAGKRLSAQEVGLLRAWIDQGANWPVREQTSGIAGERGKDEPGVPKHWAFQPVKRPEAPAVGNRNWVRNPIDNFILARLEAEGIEPSPEAGRVTLIRRLSFDLIGLPPTPKEVAEFLADNRPDAYERLVDRLLDSPHYGEKWARHWLDLARYADSDGYEKDLVRPHAWRYRHWVIEALNRDLPFDQFTIEQIAGDLLPQATIEQKVATGFHRNALTNREGGVNIEQFRYEKVVDQINTVGTVWLGLTVGCAQCHDHKYDPLSQKEYYQLFAFFNSAEEVNIDAPLEGEMGPYLQALPEYRKKRTELLVQYRVPDLQPAWEKKMLEAAANPGKWTDWDHAYDAIQKLLDGADKILRMEAAARTQKQQDALSDHFIRNYHRVIGKEMWEQLKYKELRKQLSDLAASFPALSEAQTIAEDAAPLRTHIAIRGDYRNNGIEVHPGTPEVLHALPPHAKPSRLALARWLVSRGNPLTTRVTVNRIWQEYFGRGIVRTSEDFGTQGEKPSHPELLDYLASELVDRHWSLKQLHRLIVTSAAYRQSSKARPELQARDAENALLARQARLRLPAELIRDSGLAVSGLLYPVIGGRSVRPPQPAGLDALGYADSVKWVDSQGTDRYRRGLYILFQRTVPYPQLMHFDSPDASVTACRRERSNTTLQALNLLNDPVFVEMARGLAMRILLETSGTFTDRIDFAFQQCLARKPSSREREWLTEYYEKQKQMLEKDAGSVPMIFPVELRGVSNIEAAAWVALSSVLLNLDEFITRE